MLEALLTNLEMSVADRLTIETGTPGSFLMEQAGAAVAREAERLLGKLGRVVVFCGPGNNGGDGFVAARLLAARGHLVEVGLLGKAEALHGDARRAAEAWPGVILPVDDLLLDRTDLVIDALFGAGLTRDLDGHAAAIVTRLVEFTRGQRKPVLAVDVPSGIDGSTGAVRGIAVEATCSVTFFCRKPGHMLLPGRLHCGETIVADIGIPHSVLSTVAPKTFANNPAAWKDVFPVPRIDGHKYTRGHALVVSGGLAHTGAARLAARGALRAGAGLVTVATPTEALAVHAAALTAIMTRTCDGPADLATILADRRKNALVMGPGLGTGEATRALFSAALESDDGGTLPPRAIVLDADALTSFQGDVFALSHAIKASGAPLVLTPHEGEFSRLFSGSITADADLWQAFDLLPEALPIHVAHLGSESKLERARAAAALTGAVVLLKGPDTVVAHPTGRATISEDLPPWLATAGSGDVLAGMIGGLLAQSVPAFEAANAAVWLHAAAAREFGPGLIAEDIPEMLPRVLRAMDTERAPHDFSSRTTSPRQPWFDTW
jgi:hydroxyethylthiazole kinase-like uncharacterized protein yjeF